MIYVTYFKAHQLLSGEVVQSVTLPWQKGLERVDFLPCSEAVECVCDVSCCHDKCITMNLVIQVHTHYSCQAVAYTCTIPPQCSIPCYPIANVLFHARGVGFIQWGEAPPASPTTAFSYRCYCVKITLSVFGEVVSPCLAEGDRH